MDDDLAKLSIAVRFSEAIKTLTSNDEIDIIFRENNKDLINSFLGVLRQQEFFKDYFKWSDMPIGTVGGLIKDDAIQVFGLDKDDLVFLRKTYPSD